MVARGRGRSSVVERQLPKLNVGGSIPLARSIPPQCRVPARRAYRAPASSAIHGGSAKLAMWTSGV